MQKRGARAEQQRSLETRGALIAAARQMFGEIGYHATGTGEVVARAQVTRGALYHHFANKDELFETVYRQVEQEVADEAQGRTRDLTGQTLPRAMASLNIYLHLLGTRTDVQRILLIDGPAVLGWERWRAIRSEFEFSGWVRTLSLLVEQGQMAPVRVEPLAQIILAAVDEAVRAVTHSPTPEGTLAEMSTALRVLIGGLMQGPEQGERP